MSRHRLARQLAPMDRRRFMVGAASRLLGLSVLPGLALAEQPASLRKPTAKKVIYLFMAGGMSHLDTFDMKPGNRVQGPVKPIGTSASMQISEYLPRLARLMHDVAVINSMQTTQGAHEPGQYVMHTSFGPRGTVRHPALGAWLSHAAGRLNPVLPGNVLIGGNSRHPGSGFLDARHTPVPIADPNTGLPNVQLPAGITERRFDRRLSLLTDLNQDFRRRHDDRHVQAYHELYDEAAGLMHSDDLAVFDLSNEDQALRESYGDNPFGQGCLLARRLIEADVRFVEVELGGWDTHVDNFTQTEAQAAILDQGLSSLLIDLRRRGQLEDTLVVLATEFGRTPAINGNRGRDHHPAAFSCLLAGGGVVGGRRWGRSDDRGARVLDQAVSVADFNATIAFALGLPWNRTWMTHDGRPMKMANKGRPVAELFS